MGNRVKLSDLRSRARARAEIRTVYVSNADLDVWINAALLELYDHITAVNPDFLLKMSGTITVVSGTEAYPLPDDFATLRRCEIEYQTNDWRPLAPFNFSEKANWNFYTPTRLYGRYRVLNDELHLTPRPTWTGSVRLWYTPVPILLVDPGDTADFIFGFDEFVSLECGLRQAEKEESDTQPWVRRKADQLDRIMTRVKSRNVGEVNTIRDVEKEEYFARYPWIKVP